MVGESCLPIEVQERLPLGAVGLARRLRSARILSASPREVYLHGMGIKPDLWSTAHEGGYLRTPDKVLRRDAALVQPLAPELVPLYERGLRLKTPRPPPRRVLSYQLLSQRDSTRPSTLRRFFIRLSVEVGGLRSPSSAPPIAHSRDRRPDVRHPSLSASPRRTPRRTGRKAGLTTGVREKTTSVGRKPLHSRPL